MGIKGLNNLLKENAPLASKSNEIKTFFGRKVAIDASMCLYQFLIAVRQQDGQQLTNDDGETTSHLMGMFYRTLRMIDNSIKPCYVFDGKPPVLKGGELEKRLARREQATKNIEALKESGTAEELAKFERRTVKVTREQNEEAKKLLDLMGIPYVNAPCEAEAQCAELAKGGKVYAAASEDMDTLCYKTPFLLRHLTFSEQRKEPIQEIDVAKVLEALEMDQKQFVDLCILLGCDYCESIRGVGPVSALKLIKEYGTIEGVLEFIKSNPDSKYKIPEDWPYEGARELFLNPDVIPAKDVELKWREPDEAGLLKFMVEEKGFSEERIKSGIERLKKGLKTTSQGRLDGFFKVRPKTPEELAKAKKKRQAEEAAKKKGKKLKKK
ncbi:K04799 flap endonuclease-1 [Cyberlindnera jadinii]|uniref:Flap endonuclease 1 n=1 Tax=Cyberlindnera jadinii (strain ATCC 18201 / CBS 1600 / BCRC 20928 / JCM 3617 / NBRC 0987 / NRRL Y-1542) TaxID=983966 RepID=A0A0H5C3W9_CYBJN|nr:flap endonuclease 1 [Cyberlindnera jadinii NRRL Y-1542]ODV75262.1 flap endonuclease 1 [Cyberlindnera jadinii NRRL Y-1542]CEP22417.1 K04799 flap endonuclease-1 [Cyberlindnera jadinii]